MDPFAGGGAIPLEAWGRGVPLILEKEPGVEFREVAKLFITSFDRPSFKAIRGKEAVTTEEKSVVFKETPKKPQRSYPLCRKRTTFYQCQGSGGSMWNEYS